MPPKKPQDAPYKAIRSGILPEDREKFAANMAEMLFTSAIYRYSGKILAYASFADEADTLAFWAKKRFPTAENCIFRKAIRAALCAFLPCIVSRN